MTKKRERLKYEPLYKLKPTNNQPQERQARKWVTLLRKLMLNLIERRRSTALVVKPLK